MNEEPRYRQIEDPVLADSVVAEVVTQPRKCGRDWCLSEDLQKVSYGDGKSYWRCSPAGHVTPTPPPADLHAIDDLADAYDFEGMTP